MILVVFAIVALVIFTCYQAKWTLEKVSLTEQEVAQAVVNGKPSGFVSFPNIFPVATILPADQVQTLDVIPSCWEVGTVFVEEPLYTYPTLPVVAVVVEEVAEVAPISMPIEVPGLTATATCEDEVIEFTLEMGTRSEAPKTGYAAMGVRELRPIARERKIVGWGKMSKVALISALEESDRLAEVA